MNECSDLGKIIYICFTPSAATTYVDVSRSLRELRLKFRYTI